MIRFLSAAAFISAVAFVTPAFAQDVSAGASLKSSYTLDDGIVATDGPVVQGWASVNITEQCSLDVWGSKGLDTNTGDEVDLGASCRFDLGEGVKAKVVANRFLLLGGVPDITELTVGLSKGPVDLTVSQYIWDGGLEDATRVQVGYNADLAPKLSGRGEVTYETGFGLKDTVVLGADVSYAITEKLSVFATGYLPVKKSGANSEKVVVGLSFNF